ncbi:MAG: DNA gyrase subunit A [Candidatus Terrybacteria bacterium CG10_big_fil_rev_8_21_14_0_10_41_10]|uniref:DNA gyrase subunit A n=1 Tax=Candidatus Terrybacteria bacterium CG10_big_fil_rev_8_21_14_0_10_41_10 TaxID=1975026 RepID=A0A2M8LAG9_9BACT|nr:MAG: DNA gyrase subunit A [Candidatus Terrybacteria bacterium CG10_big_fil_rev_8_21_14_0_10_41_10]
MTEDNSKNNNNYDRVIKRDISKEMRSSYLAYAMSVIVSRALPDIRDGLKPVHRRVLYSMHENGLTHAAKFRKSATVVGDTLGKYHPHGDMAVYNTMARMAQNFLMRYPLIDGQGNWGSLDGDPPAAPRYTEARMTSIAEQMLADIQKDTVDFKPNYDNRLEEPVVLPAAIPQLLVNGSLGIAVGMATNIPPHNLGEVIDATTHLIDNKDASLEDLMQFVKGPDFPTGGLVFNAKDIQQAYATGRGGVVTRGEAEVIETKKGGFDIIVSSIPYQVNKSELIIKMADLVNSKKIEGIRDIRDESDREHQVRIVIELKTGVNPQNILNNLYKHTDIERTFNFNMIALVDGVQPQVLRLKEMLQYFIDHRDIVIRRRTQFDLNKALDREHILEGLKKALDHIDAIIKTIRASEDKDDAHKQLMAQFKFSDKQASAILEMKLQSLANLERQKVEDELKEKQKLIKELRALLADPKRILGVVKDELVEIRNKYADARRTKVVARAAKVMSMDDLVPAEEQVMVLTNGGYIKRTDTESYKAQKRGGSGVIDIDTKDEDFVNIFLTANTHDDLLFFSDKGKVYQIKMYELPESKRATKGKSIMNFLSLTGEERITSALVMPKEGKNEEKFLVMVTKKGVVKKSDAANFKDVRRSGIVAIGLDKDDELKFVNIAAKGDLVIMATKNGQSITFKESDVRSMGRTAGGVRGISMDDKDEVVGADVVRSAKDFFLLNMGEKGYGKKTEVKNYRVQNRGGSGIKTFKVTDKTGKLMVSTVVGSETKEMIAISQKGQVIRTSLDQVPVLGRQTQGVRIMRLKDGDKIASLTCL